MRLARVLASLSLSVVASLSTAACGDAADGDAETSTDDLKSKVTTEVVFSPTADPDNHLARIRSLIDGAKSSVDVAIYSFSDAGIRDALIRAQERGVTVRVVLETAGDDSRKPDVNSTLSGKLEAAGADVRYVNMIMHHKVLIVDGPRDEAAKAKTARITAGSANWTATAATDFDENTLILTGHEELALRFQDQFNLMWEHARDFSLPGATSTRSLDRSKYAIDVSQIKDAPAEDALFTSANFTVTETTFRSTADNHVADALVAAIAGAKTSIHLASGHLRSRPVSEALIAKRKASPDVDIKVYVDQQEYLSYTADEAQKVKLAECVEAAGDSETKRLACSDRGYLFARSVADSGISVRFKSYAYRWDHSYAKQMHHKYMVIDGETLFSGSYNLSDNAEHGTFENMVVFRGKTYASLVSSYEQNFAGMWDSGRGELAALTAKVSADAKIPLVFAPMALDQDEFGALKALIRDNCKDADSAPFRSAAREHRECTR